MTNASIKIGNAGDCEVAFMTKVGALFDPTSVIFSYKSPNGAWVDKTYGVDAGLTKLGTGRYMYTLTPALSLNSIGDWQIRFQALDSGGNPIAAAPGTLTVSPDNRYS